MNSQVWIVWILNVLVILGGAYGDQTKVHIVYLGERKHNDPELVTASQLDILESLLGSKTDARESMIHSYRHGFSGFAAHLTDAQARNISEHPDVVRVTPNSFYEPQTTRTFDYLGLNQITSHGLLRMAKMGEDIIIGVFDTGVWPESEAFKDVGLGPIPERWKGKCVDGQEFDSKKHCNRKLIGARYYMESLMHGNQANKRISDTDYMSAREGMAHGTHVASTAGGSFVSNVSDRGLGVGTARGGAPSARIAVYKVCWKMGERKCATGDILKAMDDAIYDGVDVMSLSLGKPMPVLIETNDNELSYGAFHAISKGIPVVCAGGNHGPEANTVQNIAPWIITVAATTIDRWFPTPLTLGNNVTLMARTPFNGQEIQRDLLLVESSKEITSAAKGKVVLAFLTKGGENFIDFLRKVSEAQADALILADRRSDAITVSQGLPLIINVDYEQGTIMMKYISSTSSPTIKISSAITLTGPLVSTKVADFSSRGPNSVSPYVLKPDIAAPGVAILAATTPSDIGAEKGYIAKSGTSMATPVVASLVALLRAVHPSWSPAALRSALVTTASTNDPHGEPIFAEGVSRKLADPFDFGGGLVNPQKAVEPGLVYDAGTEDYLRFLCASGYDKTSIAKIANKTELYTCPSPLPSVLDLNLPSITIPFLQKEVTLTRTVTNVGNVNSVYRLILVPPFGVNIQVTPDILTFNRSVKKLSYQVTVSTTHKGNSIYYFGTLTWTNSAHNVTIPLSVRTQMLPYFDF